MGKKKRILLVAAMAALLLISAGLLLFNRLYESPFDRKMKRISFDDVHLFMKRTEVGRMYGLGSDKSPGCFGCELNFIFPQIKLSGRYSDTLDRRMESSKSPKVKMMTTANQANEALSVRVGDTFEQAAKKLEAEGFRPNGGKGTYTRGLYSIQLWLDGEVDLHNKKRDVEIDPDDKIGSITVSYRVKSDEKIVY